MTKTNGNKTAEDPAAAARAAYAAALHTAAVGVKLLQGDLAELTAAANDLQRVGTVPIGSYPGQLAQAVKAALAMWEHTAAGREALGLGPMPTHEQRVLASARVDLQASEARLAEARAMKLTTPDMVTGRRERIEACAADVVRQRRRVAELEGGPLDAFKTWLRTFAADTKRLLSENPPIEKPGLGELMQREREAEERAAAKAAPFDALVSAELGRD